MKHIKLFIVALITVLVPTLFTYAWGQFTLPAITASISDTITVGPDIDVQVAASSSRSYLYIARDNGVANVYCLADGDKPAVIGGAVSFKLSTSTSNYYEFSTDRNPYDGAIRCTAAASTTVIVSEYKIR